MIENGVSIFEGYNNDEGFKDILSSMYSVAVENFLDKI